MSTIKRIAVLVSVFLMLVLSVGIINAQDGGEGDEDGRRGKGRRGHHVLETIAEALDVEPEGLRTELQEEGATLVDIITSNDGDVDEIKALLVTEATEHINQAVEDGKLTQAEADEKLAGLDEHVDELLNGEFECSGKGGPRGNRPPRNQETPAEAGTAS